MPKQSKSVTDARRARALELKLQGHTWAEVAELTGYSSASSACQAAGIIIAQRSRHTVDEYREQGLARLDLIDKGLWAIVHTEHIAVSSKGVCYDEAGNVVLDDGPRIKAYEALRRNEELRARLTGTNAAVRTRVETDEHATIDRDIESLMAGLLLNDATSPASPE